MATGVNFEGRGGENSVRFFLTFSVFGYRFSVKKTRIIIKLKLKLVALETELGITSPDGN